MHLKRPLPGQPVLDASVQAAQGGDDRAFASLYDAHVGRVYALCLRLSADRLLSRELVRDIFVRVWQQLRAFRGESGFPAWLHRIALDTILEGGRSAHRRGVRLQIAADFAGMGGDFDGPARLADPHQPFDLEGAIASLPAGARAVFVLHDIEGYAHAEIGSLLQIPEGSSKAQLFRARRLLRQKLAA